MKQPANLIELETADFDFSERVEAEAETTYILGIDWKRLFKKKVGNSEPVFSIPIVGQILRGRTYGYALYNLMDENDGYDIVMYPQYERRLKGFPFFFVKETVTVQARLGKLKN